MMAKNLKQMILILAALMCSVPSPAFLRADINRDGRVDFLDLAILAEEWLMDVYGVEKITDGTFDDSGAWLAGARWDVALGYATVDGTDAGQLVPAADIDITAGSSYRVTFDIVDYVGGILYVGLGGSTDITGGGITADGSYAYTATAEADDSLIRFFLPADNAYFRLDNVSVKEIFDVPVIEAIARDIESSINEITTGNGWDQTLTAVRPHRLEDFSGILLNDGKVFIWQGDHDPVGEPANLAAEWVVTFEIGAVVIDSDAETDSIDIRLNQVASDIQKKLAEDVNRGGTAIDTMITAFTKIDTEESTGVIVTVQIHYRTEITDPYTQI